MGKKKETDYSGFDGYKPPKWGQSVVDALNAAVLEKERKKLEEKQKRKITPPRP